MADDRSASEGLLTELKLINNNNSPHLPTHRPSDSPAHEAFSIHRLSRRGLLKIGAVVLVLFALLSFSRGRIADSVGRFEYKHALDHSKIAVMIEKRKHRNLVPLLHDFLVKVPEEWPFQIWVGSENEPILRSSRLLAPFIESGKLNLTRLPDEDAIYNGDTLSKFLTAPWFWEHLAPAEHIFFFQLDSVICAQSDRNLNDFLGTDVVPGGYAWLGAPWFQDGYPAAYSGGNGGFSLRRRSAMLNITQSFEWDGRAEDLWFTEHIRGSGGEYQLPTQNVAMHFAHETIAEAARAFDWVYKPFGMHTGTIWNTCTYFQRWDDIKRLLEYCPELAMIAPHHCLPDE